MGTRTSLMVSRTLSFTGMLFALACSGGEDYPAMNTSGATSSGGANTLGGSPSSGAPSTSGGSPSSGGMLGSGGNTAQGGSTMSGGVTMGGTSAGGTGTGTGMGGASTGTVTFAQVSSIIQAQCATSSCHGGATAPNLTAANLYTTLTTTSVSRCNNQKLAVPNDPANSALISVLSKKCTGLTMPLGCFSPPSPPCMGAADITTLTNWIQSGASM